MSSSASSSFVVTTPACARFGALCALGIFAIGCQMRDSEANAQPAPQANAAAAAAPAPVAARAAEKPAASTRLAPYPNGGVLVADAARCTVTRVHDTTRWTRSIAPCQDIAEVAVAYDSTAVVRTGAALLGFDPEGNEAWKVQLQGSLGRDLAAPAVTRDSMAVIAHTPQLVVAYRKGQETWRSVLPATEALVSSPLGSQTEGVLLASAAGVTALGADGSLRWTTNANAQKAAK